MRCRFRCEPQILLAINGDTEIEERTNRKIGQHFIYNMNQARRLLTTIRKSLFRFVDFNIVKIYDNNEYSTLTTIPKLSRSESLRFP